jgi:hypothetical protein
MESSQAALCRDLLQEFRQLYPVKNRTLAVRQQGQSFYFVGIGTQQQAEDLRSFMDRKGCYPVKNTSFDAETGTWTVVVSPGPVA